MEERLGSSNIHPVEVIEEDKVRDIEKTRKEGG